MNPRNQISVVAILSVLLTVASAMCCGAWKAAALGLLLGIWAIHLHRTGQANFASAMMGCVSVVVASLLLLVNLFCSVALFPSGRGAGHGAHR